jgi:uncharacterized protein (DUF2225 family)
MWAHLRKFHGKSLTEFNNGAEPVQQLIAKRLTCPVCKKHYGRRAYLAIHTRQMHGKSITALEAGKISEPAAEAAPTPKLAKQQTAGRPVIYCPVCGTNIHNVQTAVNFGEIQ